MDTDSTYESTTTMPKCTGCGRAAQTNITWGVHKDYPRVYLFYCNDCWFDVMNDPTKLSESMEAAKVLFKKMYAVDPDDN